MLLFLQVPLALAAPRIVPGDAPRLSSEGEGPYTQIVAGLLNACALRSDGAVVCWGNRSSRVHKVPEGAYTRIAAFSEAACGVRSDGSAVCWGNQKARAGRRVGLEEPSTDVFAGAGVACALAEDGLLRCWGSNRMEARGLESPLAEVVIGPTDWCLRNQGGEVTCIGQNAERDFVAPDESMIDLSMHPMNALVCGIRAEDGSPRCWGYGRPDAPPAPVSHLRIGDDAKAPTATSADERVLSAVEAEAGRVVRAGGLEGTAAGTSIQLAASAAAGAFVVAVPLLGRRLAEASGVYDLPPGPFVQIAVGTSHACALDAEGRATCWGAADIGAPDLRFAQLAAGNGFSCGLTVDGRIACWGSDWKGTATPP